MENHFYKSTGISLITGAFLIIITMLLHPSGGSMDHIIKISKGIVLAHSIAIVCLPLVLFGCYGLTQVLLEKWKISILAFIIMAFALIAAMLAALLNGLALPYFLKQYAGRLEEHEAVLKTMVNYSFALNTSLDYIFIVGCSLAIAVYSIIIICTTKFSKWIGYLGLFIVLLALVGAFFEFVFTTLAGFRVFTFSMAAWILATGVSLLKSK